MHGWCYEGRLSICKWQETNISNAGYNFPKWQCRITVRRSIGLHIQGVTKVSFCVGRCWIFCAGCCDELLDVTFAWREWLGDVAAIWIYFDEFLGCAVLHAEDWNPGEKMRVANSKHDVEREKSKRQKSSEAVARSVFGATFNPFIDTGRLYISYVAKELIKHQSLKSDLVKSMGRLCFDYSTLLGLPRPQSFECYRLLFQGFSSHGWLAKELRNVHMDDYVEFIDDLRHAYLENVISGPVVDDMVTFFAHCPELAGKEYALDVFRLCCLCLGHICPVLPSVGLSYPMSGIETVDLSSLIEFLPNYLLCGELANTFFTDPESIASCMELVDNFGDQTLRAGYDPWESVNF